MFCLNVCTRTASVQTCGGQKLAADHRNWGYRWVFTLSPHGCREPILGSPARAVSAVTAEPSLKPYYLICNRASTSSELWHLSLSMLWHPFKLHVCKWEQQHFKTCFYLFIHAYNVFWSYPCSLSLPAPPRLPTRTPFQLHALLLYYYYYYI